MLSAAAKAVLASVLPPGVTPLHVFVYASALLLLALLVCADAAMRWFVAQQRGLAALVEEVFMEPAAGGAQGGGQQTAAADKAPYLSVVVPAYNEENRLPTMLDETLGYLLRRASPAAAAAANAPAAPGAPTGERFSFEVIVVDDGSRDGTVAVAEEYARRAEATKGLPRGALRVLRLSRNGGKGAAVRRGALATRGKLLLMADADGATAVADLAKLERDLYRALRERALEDERAGRGAADAGVVGAVDVGSRLGVAVGSRAHLQGKALAERKAHRNLLMHAFHFLVQRCSGTTIRDTQCGFKLFTRRAATCLFANQRLTRWGFDVELLYIAKQLGIPVAESPVRWVEMPGSKLNILGMLHTGLEVMAIPLAYSTRMWQVRLPPET